MVEKVAEFLKLFANFLLSSSKSNSLSSRILLVIFVFTVLKGRGSRRLRASFLCPFTVVLQRPLLY